MAVPGEAEGVNTQGETDNIWDIRLDYLIY